MLETEKLLVLRQATSGNIHYNHLFKKSCEPYVETHEDRFPFQAPLQNDQGLQAKLDNRPEEEAFHSDLSGSKCLLPNPCHVFHTVRSLL